MERIPPRCALRCKSVIKNPNDSTNRICGIREIDCSRHVRNPLEGGIKDGGNYQYGHYWETMLFLNPLKISMLLTIYGTNWDGAKGN